MLLSGALLHCILVHFWFALDKTMLELKTDLKSFKKQANFDINESLSNSRNLIGYEKEKLQREMYILIKKYSNINF